MEIIKIAGIGVIAGVVCTYMSESRKEYSLYIALGAGVLIMSMAVRYLSPMISLLNTLTADGLFSDMQIKTAVKIILTAYIAQFAADICEDAGQKSLASHIETAAKFIIIYISMPVLLSLFNYLTGVI